MPRITSAQTPGAYTSDDSPGNSPPPASSAEPGSSARPHAHLFPNQGRANIERMVSDYHTEPTGDTSDADEFEDRLLDVEEHADLYQGGAAGTAAQLAYLGQYAASPRGLSELGYNEFYSLWLTMHTQDNITIAATREGAQATEMTSGGRAVGSEGAASCLIAFAKAVVTDNGRQRVYGAAIHVDPGAFHIETIDAWEGYASVFKPLNQALSDLDPRIVTKEYFLIGGSDDDHVPASARLCAATLHAAHICGFQVTGCLMPTNDNNQVTNAFMTRDGLSFCKTDLGQTMTIHQLLCLGTPAASTPAPPGAEHILIGDAAEPA